MKKRTPVQPRRLRSLTYVDDPQWLLGDVTLSQDWSAPLWPIGKTAASMKLGRRGQLPSRRPRLCNYRPPKQSSNERQCRSTLTGNAAPAGSRSDLSVNDWLKFHTRLRVRRSHPLRHPEIRRIEFADLHQQVPIFNGDQVAFPAQYVLTTQLLNDAIGVNCR